MMSDPVLPELCVPGMSFAIVYGIDHPGNALWHVRGIVDGRAVCRNWLRHKQRWHYDCFGPAFFRTYEQHGVIEWRKA